MSVSIQRNGKTSIFDSSVDRGLHSPIRQKPLRFPGESLENEMVRIRGRIRAYSVIAVFLIGLALWEWWHLYWHLSPQPIPVIVIAGAFLIYVFFKVQPLNRHIANLKLGRDGERAVGETLEELRQLGYAIFHDIACTGFNIDHVVVSSHGLFVIETKTISKPKGNEMVITFDGERVTLPGQRSTSEPIEQAIANANWLRRNVLLASTGKEFPVIPVVVFPGWWVNRTGRGCVWVLNPKMLSNWIAHEPPKISEADVHLIAFHLSRYVRASS